MIVNIALLILFPLIFLGIITRTKSFWAGRKGPRVTQQIYDVLKLLKKGQVISEVSSVIFNIAPPAILSATFVAGLLIPMAGNKAIVSFEGDFIVFAYTCAFAKFMTIIMAMDTGSSFEGMGASREAAFSSLIEPAFFMVIGSLALLTGFTSFTKIVLALGHSGGIELQVVILTVLALFVMLLAEGCRVPIDDPNTHLELTMIHEVMILDNSGPDMAMIVYASAMKQFIIASFIAAVIIPSGIPLNISMILFAGVVSLTAVAVGCVESLIARLRMTHVPQFIFFMTAISLILAASIMLFSSRGIF